MSPVIRISIVSFLFFSGSAFVNAGQFGDFTYQSDGTKITITGYACRDGALTIPGAIDGLPVTEIGPRAFADCTGLVSVTIPDTVLRIGASAFSGCTGIKGIILPAGMTRIENRTFSRCTSLSDISIPASISEIGEAAFSDCSSLTTVNIPENVSEIRADAFAGCTSLSAINVDERNTTFASREGVLFDSFGSTLIQCPEGKSGSYAIPDGVFLIQNRAFSQCARLTSITIPESVDVIAEGTFAWCSGLSILNFPDSIVSIGPNAFAGCFGLTNVVFPANLERIDRFAFAYCTGVQSLSIPDGVGIIGSSAFDGCTSLTDISIPDSVIAIGENAFQGCFGLTNAWLGKGVSQLGEGVFLGCTNLNAIEVDALNSDFSSSKGVLFDKEITRLIQCPPGKVGMYTIPVGVNSIANRAFYLCSRLTEAVIPDSVTRIGEMAFASCTSLISVAIPPSITQIGAFAFEGCYSITSVSVPDSVTRIEEGTFSRCFNLAEVNIGESVIYIGTWAFSGCSRLTSVTIPASVARLGEAPFVGCTNLNVIEVDPLNPKFSSFDGALFDKNRSTLLHCPQGKTGTFAIPHGVTSIGVQAFFYCTQLTNIVIPDTVTFIPDSAMTGCSGLTALTIPQNVTGFGERPFSGCTNLTILEVNAANPAFSSLDGVLFDKSRTKLVMYPVGKPGSYTIPDGVASIGDYAFAGSPRLITVTIPQSVTNIGQWTFHYCIRLTGAYFAGNAPDSPDWSSVFVDSRAVLVYYRAGTTGWLPPYLDPPAALWVSPPLYSDWLPASGLLTQYPGQTAEEDDPDGDGMNNHSEMLAGTNPTDPVSALVLESLPRLGDLTEEDQLPLRPGQRAFYFRSVPGKTYGIQWIGTLDGPSWWGVPSWQTKALITATTTQTRVVFDNLVPKTFFRVILVQ